MPKYYRNHHTYLSLNCSNILSGIVDFHAFPHIKTQQSKRYSEKNKNKDENILDVGCGGGLLVNYLDVCGYTIEGFDNYLYNVIFMKIYFNSNM